MQGSGHPLDGNISSRAFDVRHNAEHLALAGRCQVAENRIFGKEADALEAAVLSSRSEDEKIEIANTFFRERAPKPDKTVNLACQLVESILKEPDIKTVENLVSRMGVGKRSVQRSLVQAATAVGVKLPRRRVLS